MNAAAIEMATNANTRTLDVLIGIPASADACLAEAGRSVGLERVVG